MDNGTAKFNSALLNQALLNQVSKIKFNLLGSFIYICFFAAKNGTGKAKRE